MSGLEKCIGLGLERIGLGFGHKVKISVSKKIRKVSVSASSRKKIRSLGLGPQRLVYIPVSDNF